MQGIVRASVVVAILSLAALVVAAVAAITGALDGKVFDVTVVEEGSGEELPDTLFFEDGMFKSSECQQYGFGPAPYAVQRHGEGWVFTAEARSELEGVTRWKGTVKDDLIEGTMEWIKEGQDTIRYTFDGYLEEE